MDQSFVEPVSFHAPRGIPTSFLPFPSSQANVIVSAGYKEEFQLILIASHLPDCFDGNDLRSLDPALSCVLDVRCVSTVLQTRTPRNMMRVRQQQQAKVGGENR